MSGMWFTNDWYVFHGVIDKKTCDKILKGNEWITSSTGNTTGNWAPATVKPNQEEEIKQGVKVLYEPEYRQSDVCWINDQWIYELIWPYMEEANELSGWGLDIKGAEVIQLTRYKEGGFYSWHRDGISDNISSKDRFDNPILKGNVRKVSLTLLLNDDFEGGDLEFATYSEETCEITPIKAKAGDMIFFTSGTEHRVTPITKGTRYSLVVWFVGPAVK